MRDETYLYEDTLLAIAKELYEEYEWDIDDTMNLVKILRGAGFVIREREPRKEDLINRVSNPTLTGGISTGRPVPGSTYYDYAPRGMMINAAAPSGLNCVKKYGFTYPIDTTEENEK